MKGNAVGPRGGGNTETATVRNVLDDRTCKDGVWEQLDPCQEFIRGGLKNCFQKKAGVWDQTLWGERNRARTDPQSGVIRAVQHHKRDK